MPQASDLMGLGVPALQALRLAHNGSTTVTAAGSAFASGTTLKAGQAVVICSNADGTKGISLPTVGGDTGCLIADKFVISNSGTTSLQIFSSTGVTICAATTNANSSKIQSCTSMLLYPVSTTQWIGVAGA